MEFIEFLFWMQKKIYEDKEIMGNVTSQESYVSGKIANLWNPKYT